MPNCGRWLPGSEAFGTITHALPYTSTLDRPARDPAPSQVHRLPSHHAVEALQLTANIDVHILYTIEPLKRVTTVIRDLDLAIQI